MSRGASRLVKRQPNELKKKHSQYPHRVASPNTETALVGFAPAPRANGRETRPRRPSLENKRNSDAQKELLEQARQTKHEKKQQTPAHILPQVRRSGGHPEDSNGFNEIGQGRADTGKEQSVHLGSASMAAMSIVAEQRECRYLMSSQKRRQREAPTGFRLQEGSLAASLCRPTAC